MTKDEILKYVWLIIFITNIWASSWFLLEKCNVQDWWTLPSLLTIIGIGGISLWQVIDRWLK